MTTGPETAVMWPKTPRMLEATRSRETDLDQTLPQGVLEGPALPTP